MALLHGNFTLKLIGLRPPLSDESRNPNEFTARYEAEVIKTDGGVVQPGDLVSVKMLHHGHFCKYFGKIGDFDGDVNDVQSDIDQKIDTARGNRDSETFINPWGP
jgi:hypothetical protein